MKRLKNWFLGPYGGLTYFGIVWTLTLLWLAWTVSETPQ